ncbi:MAG: nucleotide exchange factor GrpE [Ignavibacteriaceae bacterium]|nr:nucleotide exchange factor GrpE [Ignavibacteriaceae bacterium]
MNFKKNKEKAEETNEKLENGVSPSNESLNDSNTQQERSENKEKNVTEEKLKLAEQEIENYKDRLLRKAAEFENYKRRVENDQMNLLKYAAESLIIKLLPVIDDFERSLIHLKDAKEVESIKDGVKLVYDKLMKILDDQGVKPIEAVNKPFDVHFHEAIMQKKVNNVEPHTVVEEFEKGYLYKDRVIRHSKVAVSEDSFEDNNSKSSSNELTNNSESKTNE